MNLTIPKQVRTLIYATPALAMLALLALKAASVGTIDGVSVWTMIQVLGALGVPTTASVALTHLKDDFQPMPTGPQDSAVAPPSGIQLHVACPVCGKKVDVPLEQSTWGTVSPTDHAIGEVTLPGGAVSEHMATHSREEIGATVVRHWHNVLGYAKQFLAGQPAVEQVQEAAQEHAEQPVERSRRYRKGLVPNDPSKPRLRVRLKGSAKMTAIDWYSAVKTWGMLLNDQIGDCGPAGACHLIIAWAANAGRRVRITNETALKAYIALTGYDPQTGANDNGVQLQDMLAFWRKTGIGSHKILGFGQISKTPAVLHAAVQAFGGILVGIECPESAEEQFESGIPWSVVKGSPDDGGHCIIIVGYDSKTGEWIAVTWGGLARIKPSFVKKYLLEAWAVFTRDWLEANGDTPLGQSIAQLGEEFTELTGEPSPLGAAA
jgi:hypothetical protein